MTPNQVTLTRVATAFAAVALFTFFGNALAADLAAVALTLAAIALDGVDGYLARTRNRATPLGAQLDILGDRVVENLFFTFFAVSGLISLWVPVLFFVRGTLTDFLRALAARTGRSGFGRTSMLESWWGRTLVASRASRAAYAVLKCVCFCYLGLLLPAAHVNVSWLNPGMRHALALAPSFPRSTLLTGTPQVDWGSKMIVRAAAAGDQHAMATWHAWLGDLAIGLAYIIAFVNPEMIALGGGVGRTDDTLLATPLTRLVDEQTTMVPTHQTAIVRARLGNNAGIVGAGSLVLHGIP